MRFGLKCRSTTLSTSGFHQSSGTRGEVQPVGIEFVLATSTMIYRLLLSLLCCNSSVIPIVQMGFHSPPSLDFMQACPPPPSFPPSLLPCFLPSFPASLPSFLPCFLPFFTKTRHRQLPCKPRLRHSIGSLPGLWILQGPNTMPDKMSTECQLKCQDRMSILSKEVWLESFRVTDDCHG